MPDGIELETQDYSDTSVWKLVGLASKAATVEAFVSDAGIQASGALTMSATSTQSIDALVAAGAVSIGGGGSTGVAVSGAGVYTENRVGTDVRAGVDGDGGNGISANGIALTAHDGTTIRAIAGAASIAAGVGGSTGVSVSIGLAIAINEVTNQSLAFISNASGGVDAGGGDVTITASSGSPSLVDTSLTTAQLDDLADQAVDDPTTGVDEAAIDAAADAILRGTPRARSAPRARRSAPTSRSTRSTRARPGRS